MSAPLQPNEPEKLNALAFAWDLVAGSQYPDDAMAFLNNAYAKLTPNDTLILLGRLNVAQCSALDKQQTISLKSKVAQLAVQCSKRLLDQPIAPAPPAYVEPKKDDKAVAKSV